LAVGTIVLLVETIVLVVEIIVLVVGVPVGLIVLVSQSTGIISG